MREPTKRFSSRVEEYVRFRPHYPVGILDALRVECGLEGSSVVADVGSGTGLLSELFLRNGNRVYAVEPNPEMRVAAERLYGSSGKFHSVSAVAESTTLPARSVEFVVCGQAFHWFDRTKCREEFARILRPGGWVVLVWNDRMTDAVPFLRGYEALIRKYSTDYDHVDHRRVTAEILREFFRPGGYRERTFANPERPGFEGVWGKLRSSSYMPEAADPAWSRIREDLEILVQEHQEGGRVRFDYQTRMYFGRLHAAG